MIYTHKALIFTGVVALLGASLKSETESTITTPLDVKDSTMQKTTIELPKKIVVGISARTSNAIEADWQSGNAKIFPCVKRYFQEQLANQIENRTNPGVTLCAYTNYESDHAGDYTYFIGEEVSSAENLPKGLETITIPGQTYVKFTTAPGDMPAVIRDAWLAIWDMNEKDFGGKRSYGADFEVYDERAATADHRGIVIDILIGVDKA
ncbi:MAG: hypothetical protein QG604_989 [Candidatus Dependentiae bacterium]|nr:hypothetical protein [Candidatus Dependentiae bacterium]